jgi:hypothetical protein
VTKTTKVAPTPARAALVVAESGPAEVPRGKNKPSIGSASTTGRNGSDDGGKKMTETWLSCLWLHVSG